MAAGRPWEARLLIEVGPLLLGEASGHDLAHALRVRALALRIARAEGGAPDTLIAAAYLHDLFRGDPANAEKQKAAAYAAEALDRAGFPLALQPVVRACILYHSWSGRDLPQPADLPPEVYVFRDADRLDALGAWGIVRTFAYGGAHARAAGFDSLPAGWAGLDPDHPLAGLASSPESSIGHFHTKLLHLRDHMHTPTGCALAAARHALLTRFLAQLDAEMAGAP